MTTKRAKTTREPESLHRPVPVRNHGLRVTPPAAGEKARPASSATFHSPVGARCDARHQGELPGHYWMSRTGSPVSWAVHVVVSDTAAGKAKFTRNQHP